MSEIKVQILPYFDMHQDFLYSAHNMTNLAYKVDTAEIVTHSSGSYILSCIVLSVCFLEAFINYFYSQINSNFSVGLLKVYSNKNLIKNLYNDFDVDRKSILEKYNILLKYLLNKNLNKNLIVYQNANNLIKLRNELVHFKPCIGDNVSKRHKKISDLLKNQYRILDKEHEDAELTGFWRYPCACWALNTALEFAKYFYEQILPNENFASYYRYDEIKSDLNKMKWEKEYNETEFKCSKF